MSIHRSKDPYTHHYSLDNHILEQVDNNPYLGVLISRDLKWSTHINKICNKANSTLEFIRRNLKHCNKKFKETAYISLVRSVMDYSATVWDPYLQKDRDRIEGVQRRAARFIFNDYMRSSSVTAMMESLKWTPLAERRRELLPILLFKIVNDLVAIPTDITLTTDQAEIRITDR
jgi:hypothetical protein